MARLTVEQAADRLGVKPATIYAYVSRGILRRRTERGSRRSFFDAADIEALARRGRPRRTTRPPALDFEIETALTTIDDTGVAYRGRRALELARSATFEEVAEWLWGTPGPSPLTPWHGEAVTVPPLPTHRDRLRAAVVLAATTRADSDTEDRTGITASARSLIATMVDALGADASTRTPRLHLPGRGAPVRGTIAGRLWSALSAQRATPGSVVALNAALVLLADHELAVSTVAARVAASARADVYGVVLAGMGPLAGPLHGGASIGAYELIQSAHTFGVDSAIARMMESVGRVPGFGHRVYGSGDPRAVVLIDLVRDACPGHWALAAADRIAARVRRRHGVEANIDFALAVFAHTAGMTVDAGETIFTIARTAGWIAHAIEEYDEEPLRFRARAVARRADTTTM